MAHLTLRTLLTALDEKLAENGKTEHLRVKERQPNTSVEKTTRIAFNRARKGAPDDRDPRTRLELDQLADHDPVAALALSRTIARVGERLGVDPRWLEQHQKHVLDIHVSEVPRLLENGIVTKTIYQGTSLRVDSLRRARDEETRERVMERPNHHKPVQAPVRGSDPPRPTPPAPQDRRPEPALYR